MTADGLVVLMGAGGLVSNHSFTIGVAGGRGKPIADVASPEVDLQGIVKVFPQVLILSMKEDTPSVYDVHELLKFFEVELIGQHTLI